MGGGLKTDENGRVYGTLGGMSREKSCCSGLGALAARGRGHPPVVRLQVAGFPPLPPLTGFGRSGASRPCPPSLCPGRVFPKAAAPRECPGPRSCRVTLKSRLCDLTRRSTRPGGRRRGGSPRAACTIRSRAEAHDCVCFPQLEEMRVFSNGRISRHPFSCWTLMKKVRSGLHLL